jgi:hypothetical protein
MHVEVDGALRFESQGCSCSRLLSSRWLRGLFRSWSRRGVASGLCRVWLSHWSHSSLCCSLRGLLRGALLREFARNGHFAVGLLFRTLGSGDGLLLKSLCFLLGTLCLSKRLLLATLCLGFGALRCQFLFPLSLCLGLTQILEIQCPCMFTM